jgi:predicted MFS family arabinose efflux permease
LERRWSSASPDRWLLVRSTPNNDAEERPFRESPEAEDAGEPGATLGDALRSGAFWVFALASAVYGLVASGIGLFNESILAERGFAPEMYHQALAVTAIAALAGNFAAGALAERRSLRGVLVAALLILTAGLLALPTSRRR